MADPPHEFPRFVATAAIDHADLVITLAPAAARFRERTISGGSEAPASGRARSR